MLHAIREIRGLQCRRNGPRNEASIHRRLSSVQSLYRIRVVRGQVDRAPLLLLEYLREGNLIIRQEPDTDEPRRERFPVRVESEDLAEQRQRLVDPLHVDQGDRMPE